jgi:AcrR family transcriptional regulator
MTLTRAEVVKAGVQLLDAEGVEKLSMRKLASTLETGPSTLYWHVKDKEELLLLILDETLRGVVIPDDGPWNARLLQTLLSCHEALLPRPALVDVLWRASWQLGPDTLRVAEAVIGFVAESGLPDDEVTDCYMALIILLLGFVVSERGAPGNPPFSEMHTQPGTPDTNDAAARHYPNLMRYGPGTKTETMAHQFRYSIERFIASIRTRVAECDAAARKA